MSAGVTVSVIITNWNYASFLACAIDSVLSQTRPALECIVVDDGSTDGSRDIIARYGDRITPVLRENGGQAAAFNAGFAVARGDIIMFLDADDVLKPEAIQTICHAWHPDYAAVCFVLEVIDRAGTPHGLYPSFPADIDQRPLLIEVGEFTFMPTSGNAFARRTIVLAAPFPEARWRISTDAYLLRVAALAGRILPLRQVLGQYRIHEANNYYKIGASSIWLRRRDLGDSVDLARYFANHLRSGACELSAPERILLQLSVVRSGLAMRDVGGRTPVGADLLRVARLTLAAPAPLWPRLTAAIALAVLAAGLWRLPVVLHWLREPHSRPKWLQVLSSVAGHGALAAYLQQARTMRWRSPTPVGQPLAVDEDPLADESLGRGLPRRRGAGAPTANEATIQLNLLIAPNPLPLAVEIAVSACPAWLEREIRVDAFVDGQLLSRASIVGKAVLLVPFPRTSVSWGLQATIQLRTRPGPAPHFLSRLTDWFAPPAHLIVHDVTIGTSDSALDYPTAIGGERRPAAHFTRPDDTDWQRLPGGQLRMVSDAAMLGLSGLHQPGNLLLELILGETQPAGTMRITADDLCIFAGAWGETHRLLLTLPEHKESYWASSIGFAFVPSDPFAAVRPVIATIGFRSHRIDPNRDGKTADPILTANPGQQLTFHETDNGPLVLDDNFIVDGGVASFAGNATVCLALADGIQSLSALFELELGLPAPPSLIHLVTISWQGKILAQAELVGHGEIAVPLQHILARSPTTAKLTLHSQFLDRAALLAGDEQGEYPGPAPLRLRSIVFSGTTTARVAPMPDSPHASSIDHLLAKAVEALDEPVAISSVQHDLTALRDGLADAIAQADLRALLSVLGDPTTLPTLVRLGIAVRSTDPDPTGSRHGAPLFGLKSFGTERRQALATAMTAILVLPAAHLPAWAQLEHLPEPLLWFPVPLADFLGTDPALLLTEQQRTDYEQFIAILIATTDRLIALEPRGSSLRRLAMETLKSLRPHHLIFGARSPHPALIAFAKTMERHLTMEGFAVVHRMARRASRSRIKLGVLLRSAAPGPNSFLARAMLLELDRETFDPHLILLESPTPEIAAVFAADDCPLVILGERTATEAVQIIRDLELDIFMLGSFVFDFDYLAVIVAHTLAPLQIATATTPTPAIGLSSFSGYLTSDRLYATDGINFPEEALDAGRAIQAAAPYGLPNATSETISLIRRRFGLPLDTVLLVSGVMAPSIGRPVIDAWANCLHDVPGSALVLYPFPSDGQIDSSTAAFETWAKAVLAEQGVDPKRLIFLPYMPAADVRRLLKACDLYLDSFPFVGLTAAAEALESCLPVVALRGGHAAAWLEAFDLTANITETVDEYVLRSIALASNSALRQEQRVALAALADLPHRDTQAVGLVSRMLREAAASRGMIVGGGSAQPTQPYRYLFHHMPKTAGTSTRAMMKPWFDVRSDYREGWSTEGYPDPIDIASLGPRDLIMGHFDIPELRIERRYPEIWNNRNWRMFSIVREPFELALSNYFFEMENRTDSAFKPEPLGEYLRRPYPNFPRHFDCDASNWRQALDRYWFIGTVERLEESLAYLADSFGKPMLDLPFLNVTPRPIEPNPEDIEAFLRLNALDYEIYNEICRRLDERIGRAQ